MHPQAFRNSRERWKKTRLECGAVIIGNCLGTRAPRPSSQIPAASNAILDVAESEDICMSGLCSQVELVYALCPREC